MRLNIARLIAVLIIVSFAAVVAGNAMALEDREPPTIGDDGGIMTPPDPGVGEATTVQCDETGYIIYTGSFS